MMSLVQELCIENVSSLLEQSKYKRKLSEIETEVFSFFPFYVVFQNWSELVEGYCFRKT